MHVGHQSQHHIEPLGPLRYERPDVEEHFQTPYIYEMYSTLGRYSELRTNIHLNGVLRSRVTYLLMQRQQQVAQKAWFSPNHVPTHAALYTSRFTWKAYQCPRLVLVNDRVSE
ncbi:hypothetical protein HETIRDRAFT_172570 [Heterobasidion irregulare TC 32-1]|uniref:Uncharacterized protein n=1 Tax=Heterobasidion irregulare (strain TC 32-1) TaxID=747525 RepID=W4JZJ0_HETIT|nr:uncharacterized protein HETIRDRAFT_172570 [Heterobasidion irregulare TC 32-1]ETW78998.1 hypothetical protein HETIRDRAFT_172570 [Heterobasidion irregulare TC 32-1]